MLLGDQLVETEVAAYPSDAALEARPSIQRLVDTLHDVEIGVVAGVVSTFVMSIGNSASHCSVR